MHRSNKSVSIECHNPSILIGYPGNSGRQPVRGNCVAANPRDCALFLLQRCMEVCSVSVPVYAYTAPIIVLELIVYL